TQVITTPIEVAPGSYKTRTTTITGEFLRPRRTSRTDTKEVTVREWNGPHRFIYRIGSGNSILDSMITQANGESEEYFPSLPIRIDNNFINPDTQTDEYNLVKKAFKKSVTGRLDDVMGELEEAEN